MPGEDSPLREAETVTGDRGGGDEHLTAGRKHQHLYRAQLDLDLLEDAA